MVQAVASETRVDVSRLCRYMDLLAGRHTALRTYFLPAGSVDVTGVIDAEYAQRPLRYVEKRSATEDEAAEQQALDWLALGSDPFSPPLVRAVLVRASSHDLFGFSVDHAIFEAESLRIRLAELVGTYTGLERVGDEVESGAPCSDAAAFAGQEREWLLDAEADATHEFWDRRAGAREDFAPLALTPLRQSPERAPSVFYTSAVSPADVSRTKQHMEARHVSAFMLVAAAVAIALRRLSGVERQAMLVAFSGRLWPSSDRFIGYVSNRPLLSLDVPTAPASPTWRIKCGRRARTQYRTGCCATTSLCGSGMRHRSPRPRRYPTHC